MSTIKTKNPNKVWKPLMETQTRIERTHFRCPKSVLGMSRTLQCVVCVVCGLWNASAHQQIWAWMVRVNMVCTFEWCTWCLATLYYCWRNVGTALLINMFILRKVRCDFHSIFLFELKISNRLSESIYSLTLFSKRCENLIIAIQHPNLPRKIVKRKPKSEF